MRLLDALEQPDLMLEFAKAGREAFLTEVLLQSAILHRLVLLGEACRAVSPILTDSHAEIPWRQMIAFRNVLVHQYFGLDLDMAVVRGWIQAILDELDDADVTE